MTFSIAIALLLGCVLTISLSPVIGATPHWIYWLALSSSLVCIVAAVQLRRHKHLDPIEEAVRLSRLATRGSRSSWDDLDNIDD